MTTKQRILWIIANMALPCVLGQAIARSGLGFANWQTYVISFVYVAGTAISRM